MIREQVSPAAHGDRFLDATSSLVPPARRAIPAKSTTRPSKVRFPLNNAFVRTYETLAQTQIGPAGIVAGSSAPHGDR